MSHPTRIPGRLDINALALLQQGPPDLAVLRDMALEFYRDGMTPQTIAEMLDLPAVANTGTLPVFEVLRLLGRIAE